MTSIIKVYAYCIPEKEVHVTVLDNGIVLEDESKVLQDGEVYEKIVFDEREVTVREVIKDIQE